MLFLQTNHYFLWQDPLLGDPQALHTPAAPCTNSHLQMPPLGQERRNEHVPGEGRSETDSSTRESLNEKNSSSPIGADQFLKLVPRAEASHSTVAGRKVKTILVEPTFLLGTIVDMKLTGRNVLDPDSEAFVSCTRCAISGESLLSSGPQYPPTCKMKALTIISKAVLLKL